MSKKIIIHNPCNEHTRYFRDYNLFWDQLTDELKKKYIVYENRYYEFANQKPFKVDLKKSNSKKKFELLECEYVIEFEETGEIYILSAADDYTSAILNEKENFFIKKVLISQFNRNKLESDVHLTHIEKYQPWIYFPSTIDDLEKYYEERKNKNIFIDKMYFRGSSIESRPLVTHINSKYLEGYIPIGGPQTYFNDLINYKIGFSVSGRGEFCYRDIEYMALGIPMLRFEYRSELNPNLIPNFHYISIKMPEDLAIDRNGNKVHAQLVEQKFLQVKDDKDFLNFISKNAREYYINYLSRQNRVKHTLNLLNL